jgi:uncharacterized membrane protein YjjP (DUF1212 family)
MARWTRKELADGASLCLELASGLIENGAETSRVEETVRMAGQAMGIPVESVVHPTGITVAFGEVEVVTRVARIRERTINLNKVAGLNRLSRAMYDQAKVDVPNLRARIREVRSEPSPYSDSLELVATAITCGCLTLVLGGGAGESSMAMLAGCITNLLMKRFSYTFPSFLSLFGAGFFSSMIGLFAHQLFGLSVEPIVVGSLLYLMPGLAFVSAMRDLMAGELVAGNARLAEALVVTLGMASGVLACLGFAVRVGLAA